MCLTKVGWENDTLYLEAHPPLEEHNQGQQANLNNMVMLVENALPSRSVTLVNWQLAADILQQPDGVPHEIGTSDRSQYSAANSMINLER